MAINRDKVLEAAQKFVEKKKYDKAVAELRKLVEADPNDARTLLKIGDLQAKQGAHGDAINTYESVGRLYASQGFALKAIAVYKQIREIIAKHVPQLEERYGHIAPKLAELYQQLGLTSDALAALDEVATRLQRQQRDQEAIEVFRKIVELDPTNPLPHLRLAEALSRVKDVDGAVFEFKTAAQQLQSIGRRDDALKVLERLLHHRSDPEQAKICAELYLSRGQPQDGMQALAKLQVCFQANPRDFDTLSLLARAFNAIGQGAKAIEVQKEMARVARDTGKTDLFREILERLNRVAPHDEGVRRLAQQTGSVQAPYGGASMDAPAPPPPEPPRYQAPPPPAPTPEPPRYQAPPPMAAPARNGFPDYPNEPAAVYGQSPAAHAYAPPPPPTPEPQRAIPYVPPAPAPMPPRPGMPPVPQPPRPHTEAYPAARAMHGNVHQLDDVDSDSESYEEIEEVVEDAEVVEDDGGYVEEQPDAYGYGEQETGDSNDGFGATHAPAHARGGFGAPRGGFGEPNEFEAPQAEAVYGDGNDEGAYIESGPDYETADRREQNAGAYGDNAGGYENDLPPESQDMAEMVNKTLEDAAAFRRVRLYAKALDILRQGLELEPRSMDLHEVYRDVLIESEQTEEAVEEMLVIASLYVDALDGESAARALQDVLAFDPQNQRAIDMLQELGYEIVDENEQLEGQELDAGDPYGGEPEAVEQHERLPSYDLEEMGAADVASHYEDARQVHVRGASQAPNAYGEPEGLLTGGEELPSFPLDEAEQVEVQPESAAELRASAQQPAPGFGRISMVPRTSKPPAAGGSTIELEDALDEAEFFCSRGLFDDARAILTEQLSKHPNHVLLNERLAELDAQDGQRGSGAREKPQQDASADDAFDLAHGLDALEDYANIEPAEGHANEEQQVDVEEVFAKFKEGVAKQISVDDYGSHYDLGIAYKEMSLLDDAIREFDVAARDPNRECVCRSMIGMIEIERGRVNEAIESFLQGLNARVKEPQQETVLCYEIGAAYEARKMNKDALSYFQKAMRRDPNYRDVQERVRRLAKAEPPKPSRQAAVGADDEFDRAFDDLLSKA